MAPRNETKDGANGSDEPKPERGYATLATLRYEFYRGTGWMMALDFMQNR
jgi:hypothetical protein